MLYIIAKRIGRPLKLDETTASASRLRFARVCIEIDLEKLLVSQFRLENVAEPQLVEYEALTLSVTIAG